MPLDSPAPSTLPTDPGPSSAQPAPHSPPQAEAVWRRTFLAQFSNPHDRDALQRFGDLLYTATLEAGRLGGGDRLFAAEELDAVADDLDQLAATVREISEVPWVYRTLTDLQSSSGEDFIRGSTRRDNAGDESTNQALLDLLRHSVMSLSKPPSKISAPQFME